ncbi:aggregation-promoting factor C-terminal-like domain-containing protein [Nocardiopsis xinjiangensis]|uniref:aggregation-promoting factor C-terminal-like domain-containing protein n=1 Tax=Nocardiopsis xinjiangensis TaxID=124285 RepID=UPI00034C80E2|nr:lytic transglycosylase domain-containing protein [Nocardiopsis xinjiangensis]
MPRNPFTPRRLSAVGAAAVVAVSTLSAGALARTDDVGSGAASTAAEPPVAASGEDFFASSPDAEEGDRESEREQNRSEAEQTVDESTRATAGQSDTVHEPEPEPEAEEPSATENPEPAPGTEEPSTESSEPEPETEEPSATENPEPAPGTEEPSTTASPEPSAPPEPDGSAEELALEMVLDQGWGADEFHNCLEPLWEKESNWNHTAENSSTGAYGIPQSLPGDKMASHGDDWRTNPATQISWGLSYIKDRHGSPCEAWNHSQANNWY